MELRLKDLSVGESAEVAGYAAGEAGYRDRLLAMGLTRGTPFSVIRVAPLGDPVEIDVRGFNLTVRKNEANILLVRRVT